MKCFQIFTHGNAHLFVLTSEAWCRSDKPRPLKSWTPTDESHPTGAERQSSPANTHTHERAGSTHTHTWMIWWSARSPSTPEETAENPPTKPWKPPPSCPWGIKRESSERSVLITRSFCRHSSRIIPSDPAAGVRENIAVPSPIPEPESRLSERKPCAEPPQTSGANSPFIPREKPLFSVRFAVTCRASSGNCAGSVERACVCVTETKRRLYYSKHTTEGTDLRHTSATHTGGHQMGLVWLCSSTVNSI